MQNLRRGKRSPVWIELHKTLSFRVKSPDRLSSRDASSLPAAPEFLAVAYVRHSNVCRHAYYAYERRLDAFRLCSVRDGEIYHPLPAFYLMWHGQRVSGRQHHQTWHRVSVLVNRGGPGDFFYDGHEISSRCLQIGPHVGICQSIVALKAVEVAAYVRLTSLQTKT